MIYSSGDNSRTANKACYAIGRAACPSREILIVNLSWCNTIVQSGI